MKLKPFRLERFFAQYEFTAPYLLCCSDCESLSVEDLLKLEDKAQDELFSLWLGYTESRGHPELRAEIARLYSGITSEQVLVHSGAEEAIFNFMNVTLETGDQIIVHAPYYQSLGEVARSIGVEVVEWRGDPHHSWMLQLDDLRQKLTAKTKIVAVNFPHNPTGFLPEHQFIHELSQLSDQHGFIVFVDEVYRGLEYERARRLPSYADINDRGVSLGVMSKTYGLAGLRIGWVVTQNEELLAGLAAFKDYTTICNSAPSELLATIALRHSDSIVDRNLEIIRENLESLNAFFASRQDLFAWEAPDAGPIAFPRYLPGSVEQFCEELVQRTGVLLLPGTVYGENDHYFRIGFGRRNMAEGLEKLEEYVQASG